MESLIPFHFLLCFWWKFSKIKILDPSLWLRPKHGSSPKPSFSEIGLLTDSMVNITRTFIFRRGCSWLGKQMNWKYLPGPLVTNYTCPQYTSTQYWRSELTDVMQTTILTMAGRGFLFGTNCWWIHFRVSSCTNLFQ